MNSEAPNSAASPDRYLRILDTAPDAMVVVGADAKITFVNIQTEKIFGYKREELLGKGLDVLIPERFRGAHHGHVSRYLANPGTRSMGSGLELFGRRADGTEISIEVSLSPVTVENSLLVSAAIRDITDRKRVEAEAKLNADRLASAVEGMQDAFALFDDKDELVLCNSVYRRLVGDTMPGKLTGRTYAELLTAWMDGIAFRDEEERQRFHTERVTRHATEQTSSFDLRLLDGRSLRVVDRRTAEGGIVKTIWDLTDDVRRAEELQQAQSTAEAASRAKSDFLSSMSHELRTPMNAILGFAQLMQHDKSDPLSARNQERARHILKGGEHLLRLIDDILDLSRIEAGGLSVSTEPVSIVDVLDELKTTLTATAARSGITLEVLPPTSVVPTIAADRTRLVQILMNFGSNAIKYNRPGGKVTLSLSSPSNNYVRVTVADTGLGIPADKQDKLFQPFQRAGQETGPIEGTGIGLVITKRLADLMHGRVDFHSVAGTGSEFWIDMPVFVQEKPRESISELDSNGGAALPEGMQHRILYVEDNPANVAFMRDLVRVFQGLELLTAPSAEMGIVLARSHPLDVIVMDINLPGMSGLDALRVLRADEKTKSIPIIALTAAASERDKQRGMQAGFYRYLTKPVNVVEFVNALQGLLAPQ